VAALIKERGVVLGFAIESQVTSVVGLVVLQITSCPRWGLSCAEFQVDAPMVGKDHTRGRGGRDENNRKDWEDAEHDWRVYDVCCRASVRRKPGMEKSGNVEGGEEREKREG